MKKEMQIILEVSRQAEFFYNDAVSLGDHAAHALRARRRSQMTGLENLAENALKVSDILDSIKRQTARSEPLRDWRTPFLKDEKGASEVDNTGFGVRLLKYLEDTLVDRRRIIYKRIKGKAESENDSEEDRQLRRRIHLLLVRQFFRMMVVQYEFRVSQDSDRNGEARHART